MKCNFEQIPKRDLGRPLVDLKSDSGNSLKLFVVHHYKSLKEYGQDFYDSWLNNSDNVYLYCEIKIHNEEKTSSFIIDFSKAEKKNAKEWSQVDWAKVLLSMRHKAKLERSLEQVNESMKNLKMFTDIRKLAVIKKKKISKELKDVSLKLDSEIQSINRQINEKKLFEA